MPSLCESDISSQTRIQAAPTPHPGVNSIRADNPLRREHLSCQERTILGKAGHRRVPQEVDSAIPRPLNHLLVEKGSPYADAVLTEKICFRGIRCIYEPNTPENLSFAGLNCDP